MRSTLAGAVLAALALLLVAAALIAPRFADWNQYRSAVAARLAEATGRDVRIGGDLRLSFLPAPALTVGDVTIANIAGADDETMVHVEKLEARIAPRALLSGRIVIRMIRLDRPLIHLETLADGRVNWTFGTQEKEGVQPARTEERIKQPASALLIALDNVTVLDGVLTYRDGASGTFTRMDDINADLAAVSLDGPFAAEGEASLQGLPLSFSARIGTWSEEGAVPVHLLMQTKDGAMLRFDGATAPAAEEWGADGRLTITASHFGALIADVQHALAGAPPGVERQEQPLLARPLRFEATLIARGNAARLEEIAASLGDIRAEGLATGSFGEKTAINARLALTSIYLDALLKSLPQAGKDEENGTQRPAKGSPAVPETLRLRLHATAAAVKYRNGVIQDVELGFELAEQVLTLSRATARLPGSSQISLAGAADLAGEAPSFKGVAELSSDSLHRFLTWAGLDVSRVPSDRLTRLDLVSRVEAGQGRMSLEGIDARLDAARLSGDVTYRHDRPRPFLGVELALDRLNADAYLAEGSKSAGRVGTMPEPRLGSHSEVEKDADRAITALAAVDSAFLLHVGTLTYRGVSFQDLRAEGGLENGVLQFEPFSATTADGARIGASGIIDIRAAPPSAKGTIALKGWSAESLARLAGVRLPIAPGPLGTLNVTVEMEGSTDEATVEARGSLGDTDLDATASVVSLAGPEAHRLNAALRIENASLSRFATQLSLPLLGPDPETDGPVSIEAAVVGTRPNLDLRAAAAVGGGTLSAMGKIGGPAGARGYGLALEAKAEDALSFLRTLGLDALRGGGKQPLSAGASIAGSTEQLLLQPLFVSIGPMRIDGSGRLRLKAGRPALFLTLSGNALHLDPLLGTDNEDEAASSKVMPASGPRWSDEPLDLSSLRTFDAEIRADAELVEVGDYPFVQPSMTLTLDDGSLQVREFRARLFGGTLSASGYLDAGEVATEAGAALKIAGADLEKAAARMLGRSFITGPVDATAKIATSGTSEAALISALSGSVGLQGESGVIRGMDLPQLSTRLEELDSREDLARLLSTTMAGGETPYQRLTGTARIDKGIIRTTDTRVDTAAAGMTVEGNIDLPRYELSAEARFHLTDHSDAPALAVRFTGPLDDPERRIDASGLRHYVLERAVRHGVEKVLGVPSGTTGDTEAPTVRATPRSAEKVLQDLSRQLLRGVD